MSCPHCGVQSTLVDVLARALRELVSTTELTHAHTREHVMAKAAIEAAEMCTSKVDGGARG